MRQCTCEVCGHIFAERHRVIPGKVGGIYAKSNIVWLCPNHHAAIHHVMKWKMKPSGDVVTMAFDFRRKYYLEQDKEFSRFYKSISLPYINALRSLRKHRCNEFSELPKELARELANQICGELHEWRKTYGKGGVLMTPKEYAKKHNIDINEGLYDDPATL